MLTYNDFTALGEDEKKRTDFLLKKITEHEQSHAFRLGQTAGEFFRGGDPFLEKVEKLVYDLSGMAHKDIFSPNHKITTNFYFVFVTQMISYSLGNGISFDSKEVRQKLRTGFDHSVMKVLEYAANDGEAYAYISGGELIPMSVGSNPSEPIFVPLIDEDDGKVKAGFRYWRLSSEKPLRITLFEPGGITEYKQPQGKSVEILKSKHPYKGSVDTFPDLPNEPSIITVDQVVERIPIARMAFINEQSYIKKRVATLSAYNALLSKLVNNSDESDLIYWVLKNCEGMDEIDDANFVVDVIRNHVVHLKENVEAEPHQLTAPHEGTLATLEVLRKQLFYDFMAVDFERTSGGNITTSEVKQGYENLNLKADKVEVCVIDFINSVLKIMGFENENFHFTRPKNVNEAEAIQSAVTAAPYMGDEMTTKTICEITGKIDEFETIQKKKAEESLSRFKETSEEAIVPKDQPINNAEDIIETAEEQKGSSLNDAQTQSLLSVIAQYTAGSLTENQAINIISTAIGISKDKAREILQK